MNRLRITAVVFAITVLGTGSAAAKAKSVTGTWTLTVEHLGMKLTLLQRRTPSLAHSTGRTAIPSSSPVDSPGIR